MVLRGRHGPADHGAMRSRRFGPVGAAPTDRLRVPIALLKKSTPANGTGRLRIGGAARPLSFLGVRRDKLKTMRTRQKPRPDPEKTLEACPLQFGGVRGPIARTQSTTGDWHLVLTDNHRRSFVSYFKCAFERPVLREWWDLLHDKIRWERPLVGEKKLPRSAAWLTSGECRCTYKYGGTAWPALSMEPWFLKITDAVCHACGLRERPNSCNANLYEDGSQSVGWHADDEPLFDATRQDALIVSLSLGATRRFELRPDDALETVTTVELEDGDLCTMEGLMQKHYKHRVGTESRIASPRINLTWRWVVAHDTGCPLHSKNSLPAAPEGKPLHRTTQMDEASVRKYVRQVQGIDASGPSDVRAPVLELSAEEKAKRAKRAKRFGLPIDLEDVPAVRAKKPAVTDTPKPAVLTDEEKKRKSRAARFGVPVDAGSKANESANQSEGPRMVSLLARGASEDDRPKLRSERSSNSAAMETGSAKRPLPDAEAEKLKKREERFGDTKAPGLTRTSLPDAEAEKLKQREERFRETKASGSTKRPLPDAEAEKEKKREERFADTRASVSKSADELELERRNKRLQRFQETAQPPSVDKVASTQPMASASTQPMASLSEEEKRKRRAAKYRTG